MKFIEFLAGILMFISFFLLIGVVGGMEFNNVDVTTGLIWIAVGLIGLLVSTIVLRHIE